jgi:4-amino-4-deoxy-L-arabinose transferase-like glycosyltransferase
MPLLTRAFSQFKLAALGLVLLTVVTRLPSLLHPWPIDDEAVYSVVANEIVDGGRPYVDAVERKPPLLFWLYAGIIEVTGKFNPTGLHAVAVAWTLATMAGLYVIGRQLFDRGTGLVAALLYTVYQPWGQYKNLAFNGELMMNLPLVCACAIVFARRSAGLRPELLAAGALLGIAFLLKQPAAIAAVPLGIYLLLPAYRTSRGLTRTASVIHAFLLTVGFLAVLGLVIAILQKQGILRDAFFWTITNHANPHVFWRKGAVSTLAFLACCFPLVIGAAMSFRDKRGIWAEKSPERTALLALLAASAIGAAAGGRFYPHYYIQLIPPLALLAAPYYARLWSGRDQSTSWLLRPATSYALLTITVVAFFIANHAGLAAHREASEAGRYLSEQAAPDDRIFIWGHSARIYVEARRRPACRYILTFPLTGRVFGEPLPGVDTRKWIVPGAWNILEQDFSKHPPIYIVDLEHGRQELYPVRDFPILARLLEDRYEPVLQATWGTIYRLRQGRPTPASSPQAQGQAAHPAHLAARKNFHRRDEHPVLRNGEKPPGAIGQKIESLWQGTFSIDRGHDREIQSELRALAMADEREQSFRRQV